jgi:hypothetical protein
MTTYSIFWNDLTDTAKERLSVLYHENIDVGPIATIDIEDDIEDDNNYDNIDTEFLDISGLI